MKIKTKGVNLTSIKTGLLVLVLIYLIYEPEFSKLFWGIHSYYVNVIIISCLVLLNFKKFIRLEKKLFYFCLVVALTAVYTLIITLVSGNDVRFFQHIYVIFQVFALYLINYYVDKHYSNAYETKINLLKGMISVEFIISILMFFIEPLKQFAISLCYAEEEQAVNEFVVSKRIFGIFGDYTFKCQIVNAMFAFFFVVLVFKTRKNKYLVYTMMSLVISVLNGRTGLLIFLIVTVIYVLYIVFEDKRRRIKNLGLLFRIVIIIFIVVLLIYILSPDTFNFVLNMFYNFLGFDTGNDNNLQYLSESMAFPTGYKFFLGSGEVYYGSVTDIGYCNDIALVGIIVTIIEYLNMIYFLEPKKNKRHHKFVYFCLVVAMLIANIKGVCMRSGSVITGILWLKMIMESENTQLMMQREKEIK